MTKLRVPVILATIAAGAAAVGIPTASADTSQIVTATVDNSVTVSVSKPTVDFGNLSIGTNTVSGAGAGTLRVQANVPYTVKVHGMNAKMTKYASGAYVSGTSLAANLVMATSTGSLDAVAFPAVTIADASAPALVASSVALSSDHTYDLSFVQVLSPTDAKATYRHDLTYVGAAVV